MTENSDAKSTWPLYLICYGALAVLTVISFWLLQVMVLAISHVGTVLDFNRYIMTALNQWSYVLLGILWLIAFFGIEHYLREGIKNETLWLRIGKVLGGEVGILVLAFVLQSLPLT